MCTSRRASRTERLQKESGANVTDNGNAVQNATTKRPPNKSLKRGPGATRREGEEMLKMVILKLSAHRMTCEQREQVSVACGGRGGGVRGGAAPPRANAREQAHKRRVARAIDVELTARAAGFRYVYFRAVVTRHHRPREHTHSSIDRVERAGLPNSNLALTNSTARHRARA